MQTLCKFYTDLSADSVEWCPNAPFQDYFVCGNYELDANEGAELEGNASGKRKGKIYLFSFEQNELKLHFELNSEGVLDQKWCHCKIDNYSLLGVVFSNATIEIFYLDEPSKRLQSLVSHKLQEYPECMLLSLDWSTGKFSNQPNIICSGSEGTVHVFDFDPNRRILTLTATILAHQFHAWTSAFYYWDPNIFFSGGDDSYLCKFDQRMGKEPMSKTRHEAGVTTIHSNKESEFTIASGSYDTKVRLFDLRKMNLPLNEVPMPGPVWRIKWDPFNCVHLLVACMSEGVYVVNNSLEIVQSTSEHQSMAYGVDWCNLMRNDGSKLIASCSFYDKLMCVSQF